MVRKILILSLVCLLMVGWMPIAQAPNYGTPTWNIVWDGYGATYPDADDPVWTRTTTGTVSRSFVYHNQIMNISMTGAGADNEKYSISFSESDFVIIEARLSMPLSGAAAILRFDGGTSDYAFITISASTMILTWDDLPTLSAQSLTHYEENIIASNHTYTLVVYVETGRTYVQAYYDHNFIMEGITDHTMSFTDLYFSCQDSPPSASGRYCEWDYVVASTTDLTGKLDHLESELEDLWRELNELRRTGGADVVKKGNLPFVPIGTRGVILPQGYFEIDPYLAYSYTANDNDTGNDMNFYRVWNAAETDYISISDEWYIQGDYTTIYVNDTKNTTATGDDTALTDWDAVTETRTYYNSEYAFNISVETDAAATIKFDRVSNIQVINTFSWGESSITGAFLTQSTIENDCSMDWRYVNVYWAFPEEDSDGVYVEVDTSSIVVTDDDNNLELERGQHWTTDAAGLYLAFQYLNASDDRTFSIEFNRRLAEEGDIVSIITDGDVEFTNTMRTYPFEFDVWYGIVSARQFNGKWIIKFDFSREHANKHLGRVIVYVNGGFTSDFIIYSDRMEIYDLTFEAGSSNQIRVLFDWKSGESDIYNWGAANLLALGCIAIFALIVGIKWYRQHSETKNRMYKFLAVMLIILGVFALGVFGMLLF